MCIVVLTLAVATRLYAGEYSLSPISHARWLGIGAIVMLFILCSFLLDFYASFTDLQKHTDPETKNVDIKSLWKNVYTNPLYGIVMITVMTFGITGAQDLSEYYRVHTAEWYDSNFWQMENTLFLYIKGSFIDVPKFWDYIYSIYWLYILLIFCYLNRRGQIYDLTVISMATVIAYYLTRWIALQFPTAGPAFYHPDLFELEGTLSANSQSALLQYMKGEIEQNGFIPGTMAMPSLHVGVSFLASWYFARHIRRALLPAMLSVVFVWLSTIILGWHYVADGLGGILVACISVQIARMVLAAMQFDPSCQKLKSVAEIT